MFDELQELVSKKADVEIAMLTQKEEQDRIYAEIEKAKHVAWMKMCRDLNELRRYTNAVDTHVPFVLREDTSVANIPVYSDPLADTIGIEFTNDGAFLMYAYKHKDVDGKPLNKPKKDLFLCRFYKERAFYTDSKSEWARYIIDLEPVAADWEKILPRIVEDIKAQIKAETEQMLSDSADRMVRLEREWMIFMKSA